MDDRPAVGPLPVLSIEAPWDWEQVLSGRSRTQLAEKLAQVLPTRRWFGSKTRTIRQLEIVEAISITSFARLLVLRVRFESGPEEVYQAPLAFVANGTEAAISASARWMIVERSEGRTEGVLYDALGEEQFCEQLLKHFDAPCTVPGTSGGITIEQTAAFPAIRGSQSTTLTSRLIQGEQSNSSIVFGDRLILKLFRRVETGLNPDFEISEFLTAAGFRNSPPLAGALVYRQGNETWALAMLQAFVPNRGDAWKFTLEWLDDALAARTKNKQTLEASPLPRDSLLRSATEPIPPDAQAAFGDFLRSAARLGQRTAEMHLALASDPGQPEFAPEEFGEGDRRSYLARCAEYARDTFALLSEQAAKLTGELAATARRVAVLEPQAIEAYASLADSPLQVKKIRIHGDYHLGQVLATPDDFLIIDFEGEPVRSIAERRQKQLALRDVAGMLRSFHYASRTAAANASTDVEAVDTWTASWYAWTCVAFLKSYRQTAGDAGFLPCSLEDTERLLDACLLEKAIYELRYELNNRPTWVYLPLAAVEGLLSS